MLKQGGFEILVEVDLNCFPTKQIGVSNVFIKPLCYYLLMLKQVTEIVKCLFSQ